MIDSQIENNEILNEYTTNSETFILTDNKRHLFRFQLGAIYSKGIKDELKDYLKSIHMINHFTLLLANKYMEDVYSKYYGNSIVTDSEYNNRAERYIMLCNFTNQQTILLKRWLSAFYDYTLSQNMPNKNILIIKDKQKSHKLSLENIGQPLLKEMTLKYINYRAQRHSPLTVTHDLTSIKEFSRFIENNYPGTDIDNLSREKAKEYIRYIRNKSNWGNSSKRTCISKLMLFCDYLVVNDINIIPKDFLFLTEERFFKKKKIPLIYSDDELRNINRYLHLLEKSISSIIIIMEETGLRLDDIVNLKITDLINSNNGNSDLIIMQPKTKVENYIPLSDIAAGILNNEAEKSTKLYGNNTLYIFSTDIDKHIDTQYVRSKFSKLIKKNNILGDNGELLPARLHRLRGTHATFLYSLGVELDLVISLLGHSGASTIAHYLTISDKDILTAMQPILDETNELIANIGHTEDVNFSLPQLLDNTFPLANGTCAKPLESGSCTCTSSCYNCVSFRPQKEYLDVYKKQLTEINRNLEVAELQGFTRIIEQHMIVKNALVELIKQLDD